MGNQHVSHGVLRMHNATKAIKPPIRKQFLQFHRFVFHAHKYSVHHAHMSNACKVHILTRFTRFFFIAGWEVRFNRLALVCSSIYSMPNNDVVIAQSVDKHMLNYTQRFILRNIVYHQKEPCSVQKHMHSLHSHEIFTFG